MNLISAEFLLLLLMLQKSQITIGWMVLKPCIFTISTGADVWTINSSNQVRSYGWCHGDIARFCKRIALGLGIFYHHIVWESPRWVVNLVHHQDQSPSTKTLEKNQHVKMSITIFLFGFPPSLQQYWKGHFYMTISTTKVVSFAGHLYSTSMRRCVILETVCFIFFTFRHEAPVLQYCYILV